MAEPRTIYTCWHGPVGIETTRTDTAEAWEGRVTARTFRGTAVPNSKG